MVTQKLATSKELWGSFDSEYLTGFTLVSGKNSVSSCHVHAVNFMVKPNGQLVTVSSTHYCAYTSVLSNR